MKVWILTSYEVNDNDHWRGDFPERIEGVYAELDRMLSRNPHLTREPRSYILRHADGTAERINYTAIEGDLDGRCYMASEYDVEPNSCSVTEQATEPAGTLSGPAEDPEPECCDEAHRAWARREEICHSDLGLVACEEYVAATQNVRPVDAGTHLVEMWAEANDVSLWAVYLEYHFEAYGVEHDMQRIYSAVRNGSLESS